MQKLLYICVTLAVFGLQLGCGPTATDTSATPPAQTPEDTQKELEEAAKSGKIDPATYGKGS
jgi:hypothetical protein